MNNRIHMFSKFRSGLLILIPLMLTIIFLRTIHSNYRVTVHAAESTETGKQCEIGTSKTTGWEKINEYDTYFANAAKEFSFDGNILKAMAKIESGGAGQFDANGNVLAGPDQYGGCAAMGVMQIKPCFWGETAGAINADLMQPEGNIRTAAKLMADWTKETGSWENAITQRYHPGTGQFGLTQSGYVATVKNYLQELQGACGNVVPSIANIPTPSNPTLGQSGCVITQVGKPLTTPSPPPGCLVPGGGTFQFPLGSIDAVTGIATEMGSYTGSFIYQGHVEHAGLDIGTPVNKKVPVYAIADGTVIESRILGPAKSCEAEDAGCNITIQHSTDTFNSWYTHVDSQVKVGQKVKRGDIIAQVHVWTVTAGNDHLHLELRQQDTNYNVNPRNYFPELQSVPVSAGYVGGVRTFSATRGIYLLEDGKEWAETFRDHPPCENKDPQWCWAM